MIHVTFARVVQKSPGEPLTTVVMLIYRISRLIQRVTELLIFDETLGSARNNHNYASRPRMWNHFVGNRHAVLAGEKLVLRRPGPPPFHVSHVQRQGSAWQPEHQQHQQHEVAQRCFSSVGCITIAPFSLFTLFMTTHQAVSQSKVIVGMSGGVDSSVSALLLLEQGYQVEGLFMKNWNEDDGTEYCTAMTDLLDAANVCQKLGITLHTVNFASQYWDNVFAHFLAEYQAGRTPNPDILCNREIKFKVFLDYAESLGADYIATGHYARTERRNGRTYLCKGRDNNKDQSYFLHAVAEQAFAKTLFPIGDIAKPRVRELAEQNGLVTHNKKDSTGICFIGERRFKDFLQTYLPAQPGDIVTPDGTVLGQHQGLMYYTIGQRQGLGIGGIAGAHEDAWYVARKQLDDNTLVVVQGGEHPLLLEKALIANNMHWINAALPAGSRCMAKTRYRQPDQQCTLEKVVGDTITVVFDEPQRAITPGQSIVLYDGDLCLGGGVIDHPIS